MKNKTRISGTATELKDRKRFLLVVRKNIERDIAELNLGFHFKRNMRV